MTTLGYYLTCDDAVCTRCYDETGGLETWLADGGFEDWPDPLEITSSDESDTPTHCGICEALIPHQLTNYGMDYVREALADAVKADNHFGRRAIVRAWVEEYLPEHADQVAAWPTTDAYSPELAKERA